MSRDGKKVAEEIAKGKSQQQSSNPTGTSFFDLTGRAKSKPASGASKRTSKSPVERGRTVDRPLLEEVPASGSESQQAPAVHRSQSPSPRRSSHTSPLRRSSSPTGSLPLHHGEEGTLTPLSERAEVEEIARQTRPPRAPKSSQPAAAAEESSEQALINLIKSCNQRMDDYLNKDRQSGIRWRVSKISNTAESLNAAAKEAVVDQISHLLSEYLPVNEDDDFDARHGKIIILLLELSKLADEAQNNVALSLIFTAKTKKAINDVKEKIWKYLAKHEPDLHIALIKSQQKLLEDANKPENKNAHPDDEYKIEGSDNYKFKNKSDQLKYEAEQISSVSQIRASIYEHQRSAYKPQPSRDRDDNPQVRAFNNFKNDCSNILKSYLTEKRTGSFRTKISGLFSDKADITNALAKQKMVETVSDAINGWSFRVEEAEITQYLDKDRYNENEYHEAAIGIFLSRTTELLLELTTIAEQAQKNVALSFLITSNTKIAIDDIKNKLRDFLQNHVKDVHSALLKHHVELLKGARLPANKTAPPDNLERYKIPGTNTNRFKNKAEQLEYEAEQIYPADKFVIAQRQEHAQRSRRTSSR